jgi:hypothetical protein
MDTYGATEFEALIGEQFGIAGIEGVTLSLTEVVRRDQPNQEMFSVIFRGPVSAQLEQATYSLINNKTGEGLIFLVPIGLIGTEIEYEASYNRIIDG